MIRESPSNVPARPKPPVESAPDTLRQVAVLVETDSSAGCRVIRGISNYADRHGRWHLVLDPRDHEHRSALPDGWQGHGIIARITSTKQLEQLKARRLPLVNIDDVVATDAATPCVTTDEGSLAEMAVSHLLDRGFKQFAYFAPPSLDYSKRRGEAFVHHLEERGFGCHVYKPGYRAGRRLGWTERLRRVERWVRQLPHPIAVLAVDASRARQLAEICHLSGVRVPDDVAVLAGSLDELLCDVSTPPLSSVNVASERIGHDAAQLLDALMAGHASPAEPMTVPPRGVQSRQSTDLLAIDDAEIVDALRYIR
ncbi:MAG: XylR family transcriptional regulator, partial [Planctomycetota bacterium]